MSAYMLQKKMLITETRNRCRNRHKQDHKIHLWGRWGSQRKSLLQHNSDKAPEVRMNPEHPKLKPFVTNKIY